MYPQIKVGLSHFIEKHVADDDSATAYGSGMVSVFATPAMIALMEKTALECVSNLLPKRCTTVGTQINVAHVKATAIGQKVKCSAKIIEIDRKKIVFEVNAEDEQGQIGFGTHSRFIIDQDAFMSKLDG